MTVSVSKAISPPGSIARSAEGEFDGFYRANFGDIVAMTYGFTGDINAAQDIAQETFCRAWQRWNHVTTYDMPIAWVRRVALNLVHSRWRRLRTATAHLIRQRVEEVPELDPNYVALVAVLRKLPTNQREAIVLHYLMDLPVAQVAVDLGVPLGTVKSWLHRGRLALQIEIGGQQ